MSEAIKYWRDPDFSSKATQNFIVQGLTYLETFPLVSTFVKSNLIVN